MIRNKTDLKYYMFQDAKALKLNTQGGIIKWLFPNKIWQFEKCLRHLEYYTNCPTLLNRPLWMYYKLKYRRLSLKLGFSIPINVFGAGLGLPHYGTIVVNDGAKVGANCRIHEGVTIGATNGSSRAAVIGDNVFIGSGAKIIGDVTISSNVAIGANAVVTKDAIYPEGATIAGIPAKKISDNTSKLNLPEELFVTIQKQ